MHFRLTTQTLALTIGLLAAIFGMEAVTVAAAPPSFAKVVDGVQPRIVKVYGAGGLKGLEAYQSGFLFSVEGHILTVWSHVLDTDEINITLNDGRKFVAEIVGIDPRLDLAVLKIDAEDLPHYKLKDSSEAETGTRVLAFSNLFGVATGNEPASVLHGSVAVKAPLNARSGTYQTPYRGTVYVLDAITNNPGAAGGALTDRQGRLIGMLGKELRNSQNNTWLNFAVPIPALLDSVEDILAGKLPPRGSEDLEKPERPLDLSALGIVMVPDVLSRTPPFVDQVRRESMAAAAGVRPDDLIIFVNDRLTQSCKQLQSELEYLEHDAPVKLTLMRDQELIDVTIQATKPK